jgi:hypothetical protein
MAGVDFVHNNGDIIDVTDAEAARFVAAGIAESLGESDAKVERAIKKVSPEKAMKE